MIDRSRDFIDVGRAYIRIHQIFKIKPILSLASIILITIDGRRIKYAVVIAIPPIEIINMIPEGSDGIVIHSRNRMGILGIAGFKCRLPVSENVKVASHPWRKCLPGEDRIPPWERPGPKRIETP